MVPDDSPASPIKKEPRQERSKRLVEALLDAAQLLLENEGPDALNTNRIAERAGVSIGSLYQYFDNKDAIVEAIFLAEEMRSIKQRESWAAEAIDLPCEAMFRLFVTRIAEQHRRFLALHEGLYRRHHEHTDVRRLGDTHRPTLPDGVHAVELFLRAWCKRHEPEIRNVKIEHAAFLLDRVGYTMMRAAVDERPEYLFDSEFIEEMVQMLTRYLRPDSSRA